jgi:hypothetical protein
MIIAVVQIPMPKRPRADAISAQSKSAPTFRELGAKGLIRKDFLNGDAGGGIYFWRSRADAEAWWTPAKLSEMEQRFGARPQITYYDSYVTVDNEAGKVIVRED